MAASASNWGSWGFFLFLFLLPFLFVSRVNSLTCQSQSFSSNRLFSHCVDLPALQSFLHWTYDSSNSSLSIAFLSPPPKSAGWVSWAVNPTSTGMAGSQALVAFLSNGVPTVETYNVASYSSIVPAKLSFEVWDTAAEFSGGVMRIFAKMKVPESATSVNQVWQVGPSVTGKSIGRHEFQPENLNSRGSLSLSGGQNVVPTGGADSRIMRRNIHGVLNVVSWGLLFPIGIIIARYLRTFPAADPAWFYLHISCQISAYAIGVAGWGTGMKLGSESEGYVVYDHRNIGIALFSMATLQMFALFLRPQKDHKYRMYWNIYHHSIGYGILILGLVNVFKGFNILNPDHKWKSAYIAVIAVLGVIALLLEAFTWVVVLKRKSADKPYDSYSNHRQQPH